MLSAILIKERNYVIISVDVETLSDRTQIHNKILHGNSKRRTSPQSDMERQKFQPKFLKKQKCQLSILLSRNLYLFHLVALLIDMDDLLCSGNQFCA